MLDLSGSEVKGAKSLNVIFNGWTNRNHILLKTQNTPHVCKREAG